MNCPTKNKIQSLLDGTLKSVEQVVIEHHLGRCQPCQKKLADLAAVTEPYKNETIDFPDWNSDVSARLAAKLHEAVNIEPPGSAHFEGSQLPRVVDDYELLEVIGQGGMGTVYRARQLRLDRTVAVKMISRQFLKPSVKDRFYVEASAAGMLDHPGIVPIYDVGHFGPNVFYTMALVTGGSLTDALSNGPLSPRNAAALLASIAEAVHYAHERGIIHRDLKPSNILLDSEGQPKIVDFGLAKRLGISDDLTASGDVLGTPGYIPPEQASGRQTSTTASDVYGLGAILYYLLTGKAPFVGDDPVALIFQVINEEPVSSRKLRDDIPIDIDTITMRCLSKRPQDRYETALEVARELNRYLNGEPIQARKLGVIGRGVRWYRRNPAIALMTLSTAVALIFGTAFSTYFGFLADQRSRNLAKFNEQLIEAESQARTMADNAETQARIAIEQTNVTLELLENTLYELQPILTSDAAQQVQRKRMLVSILDGLEKLDTEHISLTRLKRCRANALVGLAEVKHQLGNDQGQVGITASSPLYLDAIEQLEDLVRQDADDQTAAFDLVTAYMNFGDLQAEAGNWTEATNYFEGALPACQRLAEQNPEDLEILGHLTALEILCAECLGKQASTNRARGRRAQKNQNEHQAETLFAQATQQYQRSLKMYQQAAERCRMLLLQQPDNIFLRGEMVHVMLEMGDWYRENKENESAESCYVQMQQEAQRIIAIRPADSQSILDLATSYERLGDLSQAAGNQDESLSRYLESLEYAEAAGRIAPTNHRLQWDVSFGYQKVADSYLQGGQFEESRDNALKCVEIRRNLAQNDPRNSHLHAKLFHALTTLANASEQAGDLRQAMLAHLDKITFAENFNRELGNQHFAGIVTRAQLELDRLSNISGIEIADQQLSDSLTDSP